MPSPEILQFDRLLAPISGPCPAGVDLRVDAAAGARYRELRDTRNKARAAERCHQYEGGTDSQGEPVPLPDWRPVLHLAPDLLAESSKDLEVAALLTEALLRQHGYAGLRDGLRLIRELVERYWDQLYPLPDEYDGLRARVAPLIGLSGQQGEGLLTGPIQSVPITAGRSGGPFSIQDYHDALETERVADPSKRSERLAMPGAVTLETFNNAVAETPADVFNDHLQDLAAARDEFVRLCGLLDERCGRDEHGDAIAPSVSGLQQTLENCAAEIERISRDVRGAAGGALVAADGRGSHALQAGEAPAMVLAGGSPLDHVRNREEALRSLLRVAEFFRRTEPHSPISYALEQAVRWGRMSLPELLSELIADDPQRQQMFKLIGIPPRTPESPSP